MSFSPKDNHIIVNYHYVREPSSELSGIHPCPPHEFERQLRFLSSKFRIAGIDEVFSAAQEGSEEKVCALTFDDGFKDNFKNAVPILKKYRVRGTFFPIASVFEGRLPTTHKVHILLSKFSAAELTRRFNGFLKEHASRFYETYRIPQEGRITVARTIKIFDDAETANFKEIIGVIPKEIRKKFLDAVCTEVGLDERTLVDDFFMSEGELRHLARMGHVIGSHGLSHDALDCLDDSEVEREILTSQEIIGGITGKEPTLFAYPQSAPSKDIFNVLQKVGFTHAVIVNIFRDVQKSDHALLMPRYDTNNVRDFLDVSA